MQTASHFLFQKKQKTKNKKQNQQLTLPGTFQASMGSYTFFHPFFICTHTGWKRDKEKALGSNLCSIIQCKFNKSHRILPLCELFFYFTVTLFHLPLPLGKKFLITSNLNLLCCTQLHLHFPLHPPHSPSFSSL